MRELGQLFPPPKWKPESEMKLLDPMGLLSTDLPVVPFLSFKAGSNSHLIRKGTAAEMKKEQSRKQEVQACAKKVSTLGEGLFNYQTPAFISHT